MNLTLSTLSAGRVPAFARLSAVALLLPAAAGAQTPTQVSSEADSVRDRSGGTVTMEAVRREGPVEIDGRLVEEAWSRAPVATDFVQSTPEEGVEPPRPTEVRILYDDEAVYVGARMHDDPSAVADQLVRRDEDGQYDFFEILLDSNLDRQTGYLFRVGASGVEQDVYFYQDSRTDVNWDAVWHSAARVDSAGWTAEMRIPLSQIRFESHEDAQTWGINFRRRRLASASTSFWSLVSRTVDGLVSQSGRLTGLVLTDTERRFEVEPFLSGQLFTAPADSENPFFDGSELEVRGGVNVQYGVGSNFSLDATVNPDFGQVEVDPAVVNLSAFETFFPEKRPFFVQDARIFDFDLGGRRSQLFFSRRIGKEPSRERLPGATFSQASDRTTILGATKLTGRTEGGLSVGVLGAATQEETGRAYFADTGNTEEFVAEPASQYGVLRAQQDFRDGNTRVGAILTGMRRSLPGDGSLDRLPSEAFSGGIDFEHNWGGESERRWSLSGYVAGTHVRGSPEAMVEIQTNPQHYHQRPDADDLSVDSTATHLTGVNWNLEFGRQSAEHWTWNVGLEQLSPDFAVNDLGFNNQGEQVAFQGGVAYREIDPGPLFRSWRVNLFTFHEFRHEALDDIWSASSWTDAYAGGRVFTNADFEFHNNWSLDVGLDYGPESLSATATRGGPLMTDPGSVGADVRLRTDSRNTVSFGPSVGWRDELTGRGGSAELGLDVTVRPTPSVEIELEPEVSWQDEGAQYVAATDTVPYDPTFGSRYLFANLERTEFSLETRLSATFSPDLSLQLFLQPLISTGDFVRYKQLARPSSYEFRAFEEGTAVTGAGTVVCSGGDTCVSDGERYMDFDGDGTADYSFPVRDFNFRSLRGNAVLRWEYMPGSTLFLVWQQDRRDRNRFGDFDLGRDLGGLFDGEAENTFIVKVSHFLDL